MTWVSAPLTLHFVFSCNVPIEIALMHARPLLHINCMNYRNCKWCCIWWRKPCNKPHIYTQIPFHQTSQRKHVFFMMIFDATHWKFIIVLTFCNISISFSQLLKIHVYIHLSVSVWNVGGWLKWRKVLTLC